MGQKSFIHKLHKYLLREKFMSSEICSLKWKVVKICCNNGLAVDLAAPNHWLEMVEKIYDTKNTLNSRMKQNPIKRFLKRL